MYEDYFGLNRRPFPPAPEANYYFPAESIENARQNLLRCLERGEGVAMVVGPSGIGKTLLCQVLGEQLRSGMSVVHLCSGRLGSRSALYQSILHGLDRPYRGMDEGELRLALVDYLTDEGDCPKGLALLIDEAHTLPLRLLDEVRMLTNLVCSGKSRVRVLLAGNPILEERFASPKLESFSQRLVARCYLEPFTRAETEQYVPALVDAAGGDSEQLFDNDATVAVHQATEGVPRLINQLCDHALVLAYADGQSTIDAGRIEAAWADLQQLPAPWTGESDAGSPNIIEFGGLEDEAPTFEESASAETTPLEAMSTEDEPDAQVDELERALSELQDTSDTEDDVEPFRPAGTIGPEIELTFDEPHGPFSESYSEEEEIVQPHRGTAVSESGQPAHESPAAETRQEDWPAAEQADNAQADRKLIVIEEETEPDEVPAVPQPSVRRPNQYGRLFAKLRES